MLDGTLFEPKNPDYFNIVSRRYIQGLQPPAPMLSSVPGASSASASAPGVGEADADADGVGDGDGDEAPGT